MFHLLPLRAGMPHSPASILPSAASSADRIFRLSARREQGSRFDRHAITLSRPLAGDTGRNETPERTWERRSQVVAAEPGKEFAFVVGGNLVRWGYTFTPAGDGTEVTESWEVLPAAIKRAAESAASG
jgi:hypothetical protein